MDFLSFFIDLLKIALGFILGTIVSMVITGLMVNHFVVKRIMANKEIQQIIGYIREFTDELSEHNGNGKDKTLPEAADYKG